MGWSLRSDRATEEEATMDENSTKDLGQVVRIDDERVRDYLRNVVRGSVEETLNAMLEARSEERRVGKECGARWGPADSKQSGRDEHRIINVHEYARLW